MGGTGRSRVVGISLDTGTYSSFVDRIIALGRERVSSYVCVANVHMTVEAYDDPAYADIVNGADLVAPDGMPLIMALRLLHDIRQERVSGMNLIVDIVDAAARENLSVFFYGSKTDVLEKIRERIRREHPDLEIAGMHSPPFRELTGDEKAQEVAMINRSGANILLVALGCPKQEVWMSGNRGKIRAAMVGLGGAFPVYAGTRRMAPAWMQNASLEWLYRLAQEPRRLWKRYAYTNTKFLALLARELCRGGRKRPM
jgi:N-acetylglucosaminyldiphosphoundecaprenol N-acetyl-beta-D-mannosaminyltransferase